MSYKILIVDDSNSVRQMVKKTFEAFDCEILEAANGADGLLKVASEHPDLIVLDVAMPIMDGTEMLTKLKSDMTTGAIPVIMLTGDRGRDNVHTITKLGVRDFLAKPFREEAL